MLNQPTIDKLIKMRMSVMADAYRQQMEDPTISELSFEDRFGMLVDAEYWSRHNNRLKRNIHSAALDQPHASLADIIIGILLFFIIGCEFFLNYKIIINKQIFKTEKKEKGENE